MLRRLLQLFIGLVLYGVSTAMFVRADLGADPWNVFHLRDGLMTGIHARTGWPVRRIRTAIEVSVLLIGWLLGGTVGVGTVLYALAIGPLIQLCLPWFRHQPQSRTRIRNAPGARSPGGD